MGVFVCSPHGNSSRPKILQRLAPTKLSVVVCLIAVSFGTPADAQLVINELYYDHPGADDGYEFVEIMNVAETPVDLAGVTVEFHNGAAEGWEIVWTGSTGIVPARGLFTIGGRYVQPPPDVAVDPRLQNGPDALRLTIDGRTVDKVGYGGLDDPHYLEGSGAPKVKSGQSLARVPDGIDTDNNALDFTDAVPSAGLYNVPRHDAMIAVASPTRTASVLPDDGRELLVFSLINNGQYDIAANEVSVELQDSTDTANRLLDRLVNAEKIAPAGKAAVTVTAALTPGYHSLLARIRYPPDERDHNNELTLLRRVGGLPLLVSEVLCYPVDGCPQFVELFNAGSDDIDIRGYMLRDKSHHPTSIVAGALVIPAGGYLAVTPDAAALLGWFTEIDGDAVVQHEGTWPTLNRSGSGPVSDSVVVTDHLALPVDEVGYPPVDKEFAGRSLERVDLYPGVRAPTWVVSLDPSGASPGRANERSLLERPQEGAFEVSPRTFSPYDGETTTIAVNAGAGLARDGASRVVVSVYDMRGRRLSEVGSAVAFPAVFVWDGSTGDGRLVPPGLYVLVCESYLAGGEPRGARKVVVGCGRRAR